MKPAKVAAWVGAVTGLSALLWGFYKWKISDQKHSMDDVSNWTEFVKGCRAFFDANQGCPMFHLIDVLDELYSGGLREGALSNRIPSPVLSDLS